MDAIPQSYIETLRECHGLLPLGTGGKGCPLFYEQSNVIEAMFNHAKGVVVEPQRNPISTEEVRKRRALRLEDKPKRKLSDKQVGSLHRNTKAED